VAEFLAELIFDERPVGAEGSGHRGPQCVGGAGDDQRAKRYSLENYRDRLRALYEDASAWPVVTSGHRFLLVASKPG
jgi:hypothetical protein